MADWEKGEIEVGYFTDAWGPYHFYFPIASSIDTNDGLIPFGATIQSVVVRAFLGNVNRKSDLTDETEITDDLIINDYVLPSFDPTIIDGDTVRIRLIYPGDTYKGEKVTLVFECVINEAAAKAFYWQYVRIR